MDTAGNGARGRLDRTVEALGLPHDRQALRYGVGALINAVGTGLFYPFSLLYFHHQLGMPLGLIGLALSIATAASLLGVAGAGRLVDRLGARPVLVAASVLRGGAYLGFVFAASLPTFVACALVDALCMRVGQLAEQAAIAETAEPDEQSRWYALSRTTLNAGIGGGALLAGLLVSTTATYLPLLVGNAVSFFVAALLYAGLRSRTVVGVEPPRRLTGSALRDRLFLLVAGANAVLWLCALMVDIGLPVFLVEFADAPAWLVGLVFGLNTALVILIELPLTKHTNHRPRLTVVAWGALCHLVAFALLLPLLAVETTLLVTLLVVGVVTLTLGEVLTAVAATVATTALAPAARRGGYLAVSHLMMGVASAGAPILITGTLAVSPLLTWIVAGILSALVAVVMFAVSGRVQQRIDAAGAATVQPADGADATPAAPGDVPAGATP
ncbi:MFS transporter [Micromonospora echinofusca]|uniref:MFS transporter n=1 Tax=Micromonospora echinofusca TaxID=47858 RepID=A0ABS3W0F9_MICEH|nr:MFS transporter [Micromonospora echinofusca]MBO4210276.1 MFS transporter [Micromonospora echinofusca]